MFQATNERNLTRENWDIAKKGKPQETQASTKQKENCKKNNCMDVSSDKRAKSYTRKLEHR